MELGKKYKSFDEVKADIMQADTDVHVKVGIVAQGKLGSLVAMRTSIEEYLGKSKGQLIYYTITGQPLYIVHFNDLSVEKQQSLENRRGQKV